MCATAKSASVARRTAANRSSMLRDRLAGKRTEIEQLNGALLRIAQRHGIGLPMHSAIVQIVRLMEKG